MFNLIPENDPRSDSSCEIMTEIAEGRLTQDAPAPANKTTQSPLFQKPANASKPATLDFIAFWDGDLVALRDHIDVAINWGPFELHQCKRLNGSGEDSPQVLCSFIYHGADKIRPNDPDIRGQFEQSLKTSLKKVTNWQNI